MDNFDRVFDAETTKELEMDQMFEEDGDLIDTVCGFNESGECETDFDELHQTDHTADPDDIRDEIPGDDTDNAPSGAEGTDSDPAIDLAMGECRDDFSCNGVNGKSEADEMYEDYDSEDPSATTGEGSDVNMDPQDIDGEFDKIAEAAKEAAMNESEDEGLTDENETGEEELTGDDVQNTGISEDMDATMDNIDKECGDGGCDPVEEESHEYEEGDSDLVDLVSGGGEY